MLDREEELNTAVKKIQHENTCSSFSPFNSSLNQL